jgi:hypothetical protein
VQSNRTILKPGTFKNTQFTVEAGEWISLPELQQGANQGKMDLGCRLNSLRWQQQQGLISIHISTSFSGIETGLPPGSKALLAELFSEPIVLHRGICGEVIRYNNWLIQSNEDIETHASTPRMNP